MYTSKSKYSVTKLNGARFVDHAKHSVWIKSLFSVVYAIIVMFPLYNLLLISLKSSSELTSSQFSLFVVPDFSSYRKVFITGGIIHSIKNSCIVATVSTLFALLFGLLFAYGFVHIRMRYKKALLFAILITRMFPPITTLIPVYIAEGKVGLADTALGLILPYISFQIPLDIWIVTEFVRQIPHSIEESAMLDGCGPGRSFLRITVPLSMTGVVAAGILTFIYNWNELMFAVTLTSQNAKTLPVILKAYTESEGGLQWGSVAAIGMVTLFPIILFYAALNKYLEKGLIAGAVKG